MVYKHHPVFLIQTNVSLVMIWPLAECLAACGGLGRPARRDLCHAAFSRWIEWYADTPSVEESFPWANSVDDDI